MTLFETEANPNTRVGPIRWGRPPTKAFFEVIHEGI